MNRNVSIVVVILVLVVIAGYLIWLRNKYQPPISPKVEEQQEVMVSPTPESSVSAKEATESTPIKSESMKEKTSTSSSSNKK